MLIGFYRFYFYKGRLREALEIDRQLNVFTSEQRAEIAKILGNAS